MRENYSLNIFYFFFATTSLGSILSATATFLNIDSAFHSVIYLGFALGLDTLLVGLSAPYMVKVIARFGLWKTTLTTQLLGILFLTVLAAGFRWSNFPLLMLGLLLGGFPSLTLVVASNVTMRSLTNNEESYRKSQGSLSVIRGCGMLFATLTAVWLKHRIGITGIYIFDGATFFIASLLLLSPRCGFKNMWNDSLREKEPSHNKFSFRNRNLLIATASLIALYSLIGLPPLIAGAKTALSKEIPDNMRQIMWSLEALAFLLGGYLYRRWSKFREAPGIPFIFWLNGLFLLPFFFWSQIWLIIVSTFLLCLTFTLGFSKIRDDLILSNSGVSWVETVTGHLSLVSNLMMSISPFLIGCLIYYSGPIFLIVILVLQLCLLILSHRGVAHD
jgi:MFS family permease